MKVRRNKRNLVSFVNESRLYIYSKQGYKDRGPYLIRIEERKDDDRPDSCVVSVNRKK